MTDSPVLLDVADGVGTITINRPEAYNSLDVATKELLLETVRQVADDPAVRCVVLTGTGKAFCTGQDLKEHIHLLHNGGSDILFTTVDKHYNPTVLALANMPKPVIAAVNGVAAGAGANLALACDVRFASDAARFGETFVKIGLHPDWGGSWSLPRTVGVAKALELCWGGELIDAAEMLRLGIAQRVWSAAEFDAAWRAWARALAAAPATSVRAIKASLVAAPGRTLAQALDAESAAQRACWDSGDAAEGVRAFAEKRAPRFRADAGAGAPDTAPSAAARRFE